MAVPPNSKDEVKNPSSPQMTPAQASTELMSYLEQANAEVRDVATLLNRGADINFRDTALRLTPLMRAAGNGHNEIVTFLLSRPNIDANAVDEIGQTALMYALRFHKIAAAHAILDSEKFTNFAACDDRGLSALKIAQQMSQRLLTAPYQQLKERVENKTNAQNPPATAVANPTVESGSTSRDL